MNYRQPVGWPEVLIGAAVIYGLIWLESHVPHWQGLVFIWAVALYLVLAAVRLAIGLFRLLK